MKCVVCRHGETVRGVTTVTLEKGDATIVFRHVPARVCDNCGEKYVDDQTASLLLRKASELVKNGTLVDIREFGESAA